MGGRGRGKRCLNPLKGRQMGKGRENLDPDSVACLSCVGGV